MNALLKELTIARAHQGYRDGEFTARQVVEYYLRRIESVDQNSNGPNLNSILGISTSALAEADDLDAHLKSARELKGSLHGIPIVIKDSADTNGLVTTYGSKLFKDYIPTKDATLVAKLRAAGAIILAKTTMPDWAASWHSISSVAEMTRNPYDLERDPGGSSSGTGSAVAADLGLLGIGGDTGGSIRLPSSFCGLVGIRCTPGIVSRAGTSPLLVPQDTPGPMCRTVMDTALLLDVLAGFDENDPYTSAAVISGPPVGGSYAANFSADKIKTARIGVLRALFGPDAEPDSQSVNLVIKAALQNLQQSGTTLIDVEVPNLGQLLQSTFTYLQRSQSDLDAFLSRHRFLKTSVKEIYDSKQYHPALKLFEFIATEVGAPEKDPMFLKCLSDREQLQQAIIATMAKHQLDALTFPDVKIPPPLLKDVLSQRWLAGDFPTNTMVASQSLMPAISVPAGLTRGDKGLPVGLELVGLPYREQALLELAYGVEQLTLARKPPIL